MQKESNVKNIQPNGTWESNHGTMYKYEIEMENGDVGEYISKNYTSLDQLKFKKGDKIYYDFQDGKFPKVKSPSTNPPAQSGYTAFKQEDPNKQIMIVRQSSLKLAIEYCNLHGKAMDKGQVTVLAEYFTNYVMTGPPKSDTEKLMQEPAHMLDHSHGFAPADLDQT